MVSHFSEESEKRNWKVLGWEQWFPLWNFYHKVVSLDFRTSPYIRTVVLNQGEKSSLGNIESIRDATDLWIWHLFTRIVTR